MSRVRILNLPNDCTEEQLKQHLIRTAPRDAPLLEITDVQLIRRPATAKDREHHKKHQQQQQQALRPGGKKSGGLSSSKLVLRMAFVGFRTSAAGHFVAEYFNNSFFRSARLKVELAKGLNDVGVTVNQLRKQQAEEQRAARKAEALAAKAAKGKQGNSSEESRKRGREADDNNSAENGDDAETTKLAADSAARDAGLVRRQREFVELRSKATEGPTWASEVLLAPTTSADQTDAMAAKAVPSVAHKHDDTAGLMEQAATTTLSSSSSSSRRVAAAPSRTSGVDAENEVDEEDEAEMERRALARQQELGNVDDMDFLAGLGGHSSGDRAEATSMSHAEDNNSFGEGEAEDDEDAMNNNNNDDDVEAEAVEEKDEADDAQTKTSITKKAAKEQSKTAAGESAEAQADIARLSHRIRLGNIPYIATEEHIKQFAASLVGPVEAVHIPLTKDTRQNKGAAFVRFALAEDAVRALQLCRGAILMGRLLRVSAAEEDPHSRRVLEREAALASTAATQAGNGGSLAGSSQFKKDNEAQRRAEGESGTAGHVTWNTMYMNSHAAVNTVAQRLGVRSEDVVGVQAKGAAVRAAIAEAYLTSEVQQVLSDEGIAFDLLESATQNFLKARSNTTILVKNLQLKDGNDAAALTKLFVRFGVLETSAFPSAGTFALFRFSHPQDARVAFTRLSYKLFNTSPLFLEWAPVGALTEDGEGGSAAAAAAADLGLTTDPSAESSAVVADGVSSAAGANAMVFTLFITNVPFQTTEDELHAFLMDACPRLARAPDTLIKRLVLQKEQGRAFLTVADESTLTYCVAKINGKTLAGRALSCVVSKQTVQMQQQKAARAAEGEGGSGASMASHDVSRGGLHSGAHDDDDGDDPTKTAVIARRRGGEADGSGAGGALSKVPPGCDPLKLIVKNLPFEATEKDVRELFAAFSEIRTVRVPRKSHTFSSHRENNHRGFAFVEFLSEAEAARALETLKATHLYGRHLVLQYAKLDG